MVLFLPRSWYLAVNLCELIPWVSGMDRFLALEVADSAQQVVVLEGSMRANDDEEAVAEPCTFVPSCRWYQKLPCSCTHVRFDTDKEGGYLFKHGWDRLWHLHSLLRGLTVQNVFSRTETMMQPVGLHFWHTSGFGLFKNSLDVSFFIANAYGSYFDLSCNMVPECKLTMVFSQALNWLITMKQFMLFPLEAEVAQYQVQLEEMSRSTVAEIWKLAPWELLVQKALWSETFLYVIEQLEDLISADGESMTMLSPRQRNATDNLPRVLARVGANAACFTLDRWPATSKHLKGINEKSRAVRAALETAFNFECSLHVVKRLVIFGHAVRGWLPKPRGWAWPATTEPAERLPLGPWMYRLCGEGIVHRRVGKAELHFLAGDVTMIGGVAEVELLWMATSDDSCVMVGTNFHNKGNSYYSFAHTLPASHLVHWHCSVRESGSGLPEGRSDPAATISFSGFLSVTACKFPAKLIGHRGKDGADIPKLEVSLTAATASSWSPEVLHLCPVPRPVRRRFLSACTTTLHNAGYIHKIAPNAIEDWINYHLLIGVEHFTLFDNDGSYKQYVDHFVERGVVKYYGNFPESIAPKLGLLSAGLKEPKQQRAMLVEPHAIEKCMWENRHVSDWVVVIHSFEEYLHSPEFVKYHGKFPLGQALRSWAREMPDISVFELFQEPMGGEKPHRPRSVLSAWPWKRGLNIEQFAAAEGVASAQTHSQPFSFIADPLNVLQTAVHFAQSRAHGQNVVSMPQESLRLNHYVDLGSNTSRCLHELGGCLIRDESILWAEDEVLKMRQKVIRKGAR